MRSIKRGVAGGAFTRSAIVIGLASILVTLIASAATHAMSFSSSNFTIDTATLNNTGGFSSSVNYQLTSSGGEAVIGEGASGSYRLAAGYVAQLGVPAITVTTQPAGLVGEYSLDEGSGTSVYDNSTYANTGYTDNAPVWTSGKLDGALSFDGTQSVTLNNPSQLQASSITIEAWVNTSTSQNAAIVGKNNAWALRLTTSGAAIYDYTSTGNVCTTSTGLSDGAWHHLVAVIDSGAANGTKLYIDGVQQATCTVTTVNQSSSVSIAGVSGTAQYVGDIDQVKFLDRTLSAAEVAAEYAAQDSGVPTGITLQTIVPGASNTADFTVTTLTTGSAYNLAMNQDHDLQSGAHSIAAMSGSIASPASWTEGITKGLGFTLVTTNATAIPAKWNAGSSYAALPNSATTFYTRTGVPSAKDILEMRLRADTQVSQTSGSYSNVMTISGTASP